jgi:glycosyltransferase involved in cell wall biosynthesis
MSAPNASATARLAVEYRLLSEVPAAQAGQALLLHVAVRNIGNSPWSHNGKHPITLAYHWYDSRGQVVDFEGVRTLLGRPIFPGQTLEVTMQIEPPPRAGDFVLVLDMVEEGLSWFSLQGVETFSIPIHVAEADSNAPRVCIINGNCMINDALGNHVVNQLRYFQSHGYRALALLEHVDKRHPPELRQYLMQISLDDLRNGTGNPQTRRAVEHFQSADLYIFNYSTYYQLIEAIRLVSHGTVIFDYHGVTPAKIWAGAGAEIQQEGQRQVKLVRYADYAIAHSEFTRAELLATNAIAPERVSKMAYVVPLDRIGPGPRDPMLLERYGLREDQPVLLYIGRMAANKRIEDLVRALPLIHERYPDAVLLLVGDNTMPAHARIAAQAQTLAEQLGVAEAVIFTGQVPDDELPKHYQLADLFVIASIHEGFCIPAVEAMASGKPVIGARATALPETIGDGGLTFTPQDPADLARQVLNVLDQRPKRNEATT